MCMDLSKAFDSVDHALLCRKLEICGVRGAALCLIKSYLKDRVHQVVKCGEDGVLYKSEEVVIYTLFYMLMIRFLYLDQSDIYA